MVTALFLAIFSIFSGFSNAAIELSLESNRVERGNIGYVDMEVLFNQFPETVQAKKKFNEDLQKAEDKINLEKIGVLHLRQDLSELRMEKRFALKSQKNSPSVPVSTASTLTLVSAVPTVSTQAPVITVPAVSMQAPSIPVSSPSATQSSAQPPIVPSDSIKTGSTAAPLDKSLVSAMPGFEKTRSVYNPNPFTPGVSTSSLKSEMSNSGPALPVSSAPVKTQPLFIPLKDVSISSATPKPVAIASTPAPKLPVTSLSTAALANLDLEIGKESSELQQKKAALKQDESAIEKNLLNLENRETEGLLGKIYKVIREVASESGVSVVVDKSQILYGHDAVDLTGKVLERLKVLKASGGFQ